MYSHIVTIVIHWPAKLMQHYYDQDQDKMVVNEIRRTDKPIIGDFFYSMHECLLIHDNPSVQSI